MSTCPAVLQVLFLAIAATTVLGVEFSIIHMNDIYGRYDEISPELKHCPKELRGKGKCIGGIARAAHLIATLRRKHQTELKTELLVLNCGGVLSGSAWTHVHSGDFAGTLINDLHPNVTLVGVGDLDRGLDRLWLYLKVLKYPVVSTNTHLKDMNIKHVKGSHICIVNGTLVGFVGVISTDALQVTFSSFLSITQDVVALREEIRLLRDQGVNIIVVMVSACLDTSVYIAKFVMGVDLVVGGGDDSFLCNHEWETDIKVGPYPLMVTAKDGTTVPVVQSHHFLKYMGYLHLSFNKHGHLKKAFGEQLYLNSSLPQDVLSAYIINSGRIPVQKMEEDVLAHTATMLDASSKNCRSGECNFGNLVADSYVDYMVQHYKSRWTYVSLGLAVAGGFGVTVHQCHRNLSMDDMVALLPNDGTMAYTTIKGDVLKKVLETAVTKRHTRCGRGFLQVSGMKVHYRYQGKKMVADVQVRCAQCPVPEYRPLEMNAYYNVVMAAILLHGIFGQTHLRQFHQDDHEMTVGSRDMVAGFLRRRGLAFAEVEGRIIVDNNKDSSAPVTCLSSLNLYACLGVFLSSQRNVFYHMYVLITDYTVWSV